MKVLGDVKRTARGFARIDFEDAYGAKCSLQDSSAIPNVWLGVDVAFPDREGVAHRLDGGRMHLSKDQVKALVRHLQAWLKSADGDFEPVDRSKAGPIREPEEG